MNQGNIDTLNDLFKEYRVEFQMIALIPVKLDWRLFMKNLFEHTSSPWIRYSSYEYSTAEDGTLYIVVSADAKPEMYNPMKDAESLVLDVNIGENIFQIFLICLFQRAEGMVYNRRKQSAAIKQSSF